MTDSSSSGTRPQSNRGGSVSVDSAGVTEDQPGSGGAAPATAAEALPAGVRQAHEAAAAAIQQAYAAVPPGAKVRLAKRTSNLFRFRDQSPGSRAGELDVSAFSRVLHVDPAARTAVVGGMTTYEDLADATLRHGLMPFVVPQLKTITLGGAVTGLGIESTSLRLGMPHESVLAMEILRWRGGEAAAVDVCGRTRLFTLGESLGGVESLIEHPARMTHASVAESPLAVPPDLVRLSVGIEDPADLVADLTQALG